MIFITVNFVCDAVVRNVAHDEKIYAANGFFDRTFGFTSSKSWTITVN